MARPFAMATAALLLAACTAEPTVARLDPASALDARRVLAGAAEAGPVRIDLAGLPHGLSAAEVADLAAEGVPALDVRFAAGGPPLPRLVLRFAAADPGTLCGPTPAEAILPTSPVRLSAAFCDAQGAIAATTGEAAGPNLADTERLIWRTTARLFPDDYAQTYGFNLFGNRVRLGLGGSWGF
jgi:hypothetical protein